MCKPLCRLLVVVLALLIGASSTVTATAISIQPALAVISVGDTVDLNIDISGVTDLFGFQFDLQFNPIVLSALTIIEGSFLPSGGGTSFIPGTIDNVTGLATFTADALSGPVVGVNGGGHLADFQFAALSPGTSLVALSNITLLDSSLADIATTSDFGSVSVGTTAAVPEPTTVWLLLSGLSAGVVRARFSRRRTNH